KSGSITKTIQNKINGNLSIIKLEKNSAKIIYDSGSFIILNLEEILIDPLFYQIKKDKNIVFGKFKSGCIINENGDKSVLIYKVNLKLKYDIIFLIIFDDIVYSTLYKHIEDLQNGALFIIDNYYNTVHKNIVNINQKPDKSDDNFNYIDENILLSPEIDSIINKSMRNNNNSLFTDVIEYKKHKYLLMSQFQRETNFKIIYFLSLKKVNSPVYRLLGYIFLTTIILIIIVLISSAFLSIFFTKPIETQTKSLHSENIYFMNLAHEIKTPLTLISNYLEKYIKSVTYTEDLKIIKQNIDKLQRDMLNFLDTGKLERGQMFYNNQQTINFSTFILNKIDLYRESAAKKNISLETDIENNVYVRIDPLAMDRIVNNLIDNAIKYTNNGGKVIIILKINRDRVEFIVSDDGIGMDEKSLKYLFKPYHQIANKKRATQGVGLGLFIISKVIESVKGEIFVQSRPNEGTTFTVRFKIASKAENESSGNDIISQKIVDSTSVITNINDGIYKENRARVLFVEDNKDLLSYLKSSFESDYNVFVAENGLKALEKLNHIHKPDVIVTDLMMDELNGFELYQELSKNFKFNDIPFIFLSAVTSFSEKLKILENGAVDFINKPFSIDELRFKINSIVRFQNMKRLLYEKDKYASIGMLLGGISHEIFNPLAGIYGPLEN
ncbi:MAG TPA: ATP-binding protein, partial [Spirochaetota bacterium]|nr:ATP-binding protein [Spirochaetota bacterium]